MNFGLACARIVENKVIKTFTLCVQGGGLELGPDCDGMLNLCIDGSVGSSHSMAEVSPEDFELPALLASAKLPDDYRQADPPAGLVVTPKTYQLQVRARP